MSKITTRKKAAKLKKEACLASTVFIQYDEFVTTTREPDENDEWDRGSTSTDRYIRGISMGRDKSGETMTVSFKPEAGKWYYLVYTEYSTGDSFGHDNNSRVIFHDLYTTRESAEEAIEGLSTPLKRKKSDWHNMYRITLENGKEVDVYPSWEGYFEDLTGHSIAELKMRD